MLVRKVCEGQRASHARSRHLGTVCPSRSRSLPDALPLRVFHAFLIFLNGLASASRMKPGPQPGSLSSSCVMSACSLSRCHSQGRAWGKKMAAGLGPTQNRKVQEGCDATRLADGLSSMCRDTRTRHRDERAHYADWPYSVTWQCTELRASVGQERAWRVALVYVQCSGTLLAGT